MVDVSTVALSGFQASEKRIAVAANNIANANTDGFRAQAVSQSSNASGGVSTRVVDANPPAPQSITSETVPSNVELERELIDVNFATYSAQANLKVIKAQDRIEQALLDIQA